MLVLQNLRRKVKRCYPERSEILPRSEVGGDLCICFGGTDISCRHDRSAISKTQPQPADLELP
jgi:hypothetical protein